MTTVFSAPPYSVTLPVYSGPLDLLLQLIERAELDITRVSLVQVTGQYLEHLRQLQEREAAPIAEFLAIAARLILIKSEALLPRPPARAEGEEDPGEELARQLLAYRRYKQVAGLLGERAGAGLRTYLRTAPPPHVEPRLDLAGLTPGDLLEAVRQALAGLPEPGPDTAPVQPHRITMRDKISLIVTTLQVEGRSSFQALLRGARSRMEVVITFLALLELIKRGQVLARQASPFGDIELVPSEGWIAGAEYESEFE